MEVKLGQITIRDWEKTGEQNWRRLAGDEDDDYGTAIYIHKITHRGEHKEYVPGFFGKLQFLKKQYEAMYGEPRFKTLHEAKDNVDVFLNRFNNLKAFL